MSLYKQFGTDTDAEVDGVWFSYQQPDGSVVELRIARTGGSNSAYKRQIRRLLRKHGRAADVAIESYPPAMNDVCEAMAEHVLKGWRTRTADGKVEDKIDDINGKKVGYSQERAKILLETLPELRLDIQQKAADYRNFQELEPGEAEGNSSPPSSGG